MVSEKKHEIVIDAPTQMQPARIGTHPLVAAAMQNPSAIDTQSMRELLQLQREWEAGEAKRAFDADKINLMREMPTVIGKDISVDFGKTKFNFASLAHILEEVEPFLAKHRFSKSWKTQNENGLVHVTCTLTHALGHSIDTTLAAAPDTSGSKNPVQSVGSTVEYLKRYTLNCLLGITTKDELDADKASQYDKFHSRIDGNKNLQAVARLQAVGISLEKAQEFVQRPVQEWNQSNLDELFDLYKKEKELKEVTE
jgi:hypothetical protein